MFIPTCLLAHVLTIDPEMNANFSPMATCSIGELVTTGVSYLRRVRTRHGQNTSILGVTGGAGDSWAGFHQETGGFLSLELGECEEVTSRSVAALLLADDFIL